MCQSKGSLRVGFIIHVGLQFRPEASLGCGAPS